MCSLFYGLGIILYFLKVNTVNILTIKNFLTIENIS